MIPAFERLPGESWSERGEALGALLAWDAPLAEATVRRAFGDDRYATLLLLSRDHPSLLSALVEAPVKGHKAPLAPPEPRSGVELALKAGASLARWARSGFATLPAQAVEERLQICAACPMLGPPPESIAYGLKLSSEVDMRVCQACGCVVRRKARLPHERCPQGLWPELSREGEAGDGE